MILRMVPSTIHLTSTDLICSVSDRGSTVVDPTTGLPMDLNKGEHAGYGTDGLPHETHGHGAGESYGTGTHLSDTPNPNVDNKHMGYGHPGTGSGI